MADERPHGLMARFETAAALGEAVTRAKEAGYRDIDAFAPVALPGLERGLGLRGRAIPLIALTAAAFGAVLAYGLQYYAAVHDYPFAVGGKPLHSWPPFLLISIAVALLSAVVATLVSVLALGGYPSPYHPVFNVEAFARATSDGYFLLIGAGDPSFDAENTRAFLGSLDPASVDEVVE